METRSKNGEFIKPGTHKQSKLQAKIFKACRVVDIWQIWQLWRRLSVILWIKCNKSTAKEISSSTVSKVLKTSTDQYNILFPRKNKGHEAITSPRKLLDNSTNYSAGARSPNPRPAVPPILLRSTKGFSTKGRVYLYGLLTCPR